MQCEKTTREAYLVNNVNHFLDESLRIGVELLCRVIWFLQRPWIHRFDLESDFDH